MLTCTDSKPKALIEKLVIAEFLEDWITPSYKKKCNLGNDFKEVVTFMFLF